MCFSVQRGTISFQIQIFLQIPIFPDKKLFQIPYFFHHECIYFGASVGSDICYKFVRMRSHFIKLLHISVPAKAIYMVRNWPSTFVNLAQKFLRKYKENSKIILDLAQPLFQISSKMFKLVQEQKP